jgi:hypothetical protein
MDYAEVCIHLQPRARKEHRCDECYGAIQPKEQYSIWQGIFEGEPFRFKNCNECERLRDEINKGIKDPDERVPFNELYEFVFESNHLPFIKAFLENKEKRGAEIKPWMLERIDALLNADDDKVAEETA